MEKLSVPKRDVYFYDVAKVMPRDREKPPSQLPINHLATYSANMFEHFKKHEIETREKINELISVMEEKTTVILDRLDGLEQRVSNLENVIKKG